MLDHGNRFYTCNLSVVTKSDYTLVVLAFWLVVRACSSKSETPSNSSSEGVSADMAEDSEDSNGDKNSASNTSSSADQETTAGESSSDSNDDNAEDESESDGSSDSSDLLFNGEKCDKPEECQSGFCPTASSGDGVCSACAVNQDCVDAGKGLNCVE